MSFAAEIRDFLAAYQTVSGVLNERSQTRSQNAYRDWLMGAQDRENAGIIDYARTGSDMAPFATSERFNPDTAGGGGGGGGGGVSAYSSDTYNAPALEQAFADVESYGGKWDARGPVTDSGDRAYGKYQVMGANLPAWTTKYYGKQLSGEEFRYNKEAQQAVFHGEMKRLFDQYGNVKDAASVWFTGRPYSETANTDINDEYTDVDDYVSRVADAYAKYSGEGQVAALAGGDAEDLLAQGDFTVPEGADVDTLTGPGDPGYDLAAKDDYIDPGGAPIPNVVADDLGTSDPDYRRHVTERPMITVPGPMPGTADAVVTETGIEVPGTEPVSTEGAEAVATGGFDPLPQTTGYTDPVSRAGSADAVRQAIDDRSTPPRKILADVLNFGRNIFGGRPRGAVDTGEADPGREAMTAGIGGANVDLVEGIENAIRERDPNVTEDQMPIRVMGTIYNWWMRKGDPNKAAGAAFSIYQTYKQLAQKTITLAQMDASEGNYMDAVEKFMEGYRLIPDGEMLSATLNEDGTYNIETRLEDTGEVIQQTVNVDPRRIVAELMQITPDQFDDLIEQRVLGADAVESPDAAGPIEELIGGEPTGMDEAVPVLPPPQPGQETTPMGPTIPPDAAMVPEGDGVQVASADTGDVMNDGTPIPPRAEPPGPIETSPRKPMTLDEYLQWRNKFDEKIWPKLDQVFQAQTEVYNAWLKSQPTADQLQANEAYNQFYADLAMAADRGEYFDIAQSSIGAVPDSELQSQMRQVADTHNARLEQLRTQEKEALQEAEETTSTSIMQEQLAAIPTEDEFYLDREVIPAGASDYSDRSTMFSGEPGTAEQAQVSGQVPVRGEEVQMPVGNEMLGISREDRAVLQDAVNAQNQRVETWNKGFDIPARLEATDAEADVQGKLSEDLDALFTQHSDPNATPDEASQAALTWIDNQIARSGTRNDVLQTARVLMLNPANEGLGGNTAAAVEAAHGLLLFDPSQPTESLYTARRVPPINGMPPGTVEVTNVVDDTVLYMPEDLFMKMDTRRRELADAYIAENYAETAQQNLSRRRGNRVQQMIDTDTEDTIEYEQERQKEMLSDPGLPAMPGYVEEGSGWLQPLPEDR